MELLLSGIGIIIGGGVISILFPERFKGIVVFIFTGIGSILVVYVSINALLAQDAYTASYLLSYPIGSVTLVLDKLSAFFAIIIGLMSSIGTIYAIGYIKPYCGKKYSMTSHFFFIPVLIVSMIAVVIIQNVIAFLIAWEIMSLSSFFLVAFESEKEEVYQASINYLIAMHVGVLFLTGGFATSSILSGSNNFASFSAIFEQNHTIANLVFILLFVGFGTKAGFVPFHTWLPKAHPAAPSHISGLMSGIMIKTGIYGILRIIMLIKKPGLEISYLILVVSIITGIVGISYALAQNNIKKLLAYSSIENIGVIGIGMGIGMLGLAYENVTLTILGFAGTLLHIFNHSIFKTLLFFVTGGIYQKTHLLDIEKLGGIVKFMKFSTIAFFVGAIAISGLPPLNGFVSEFIIYWGIIKGLIAGKTTLAIMMVISFASLAFIGAMALLSFTRVLGIAFLGSPRSDYHETPSGVSFSMKAAMLLQIMMIVLIGIFPQYAFSIINSVISLFIAEGVYPDFSLYMGSLQGVSTALIIFLSIFAGLFLFRKLLLRKRKVYTYKTWDCGYQAGSVRMQYTGSAYSAPFMKVIGPIYSRHVKLIKPKGLFPENASYESYIDDKFEDKLIKPILSLIERFLNAFTWIQSGSTQQYILYGLIFLVAITLWIMVA